MRHHSPFKILMFGWELPPFNSGGLGTACYGLTRALSQCINLSVTFVLPWRVDVSADFMRIIYASDAVGIKINEGDMLYRYAGAYTSSETIVPSMPALDAGRSSRGLPPGMSLHEAVRWYAQAARVIAQKEDFDIIHAHDWLSFLAGVEAKKVSGKPLVLHMHATEFDRAGGQGANEAVYMIEKSAMEYADEVVAVSFFTKEKIVKHYGIDPKKISVVHNGVSVEDFEMVAPTLVSMKEGAGQKIVLYVGRITIQKGPEYFVRAAKRVLEHQPNTLFIVAGSGDMYGQMIEEAAHLGLGDKMIFTGFLRGDDLAALFQSADVYVMPSVSEPFGITPLEAIVNGAPVIVSKQSGVSEVLSHALKVDFWDVDEMANKIIGVLQNDSLHKVMRKESKKEVRAVNWERAAKKLAGIYERIAGRRLL